MTLHLHTSPIVAAQRILRAEADALHQVAERLDAAFERALQRISQCTGRLGITGVGKSADVAGKIAGTMNSTGTRAYILDATKALHGDLGMVHPDDVVLILSHSGESDEIVRLLPPFAELSIPLIALTGNPNGTLARHADVAIVYGPIEESDPLALAPSTSTTVMIALGDALAFTLSMQRQFTAEQFARNHPAGTLGRKLARVETMMRTGPELRVAFEGATVRDVFATSRHDGRRTGAVMLTDEAGVLTGLFTDSDLARLFERRDDAALDRPIAEVMTHRPITMPVGARVAEAIDVMRSRKISELPVIDGEGRPVGMLDVTDLIGVPARAKQAIPQPFQKAAS